MALKEKSVLLVGCGAWHLPRIARAFLERNVLACLWLSDKNSTGLPSAFYRRCWHFHLVMKLFYHWAPQNWVENLSHYFFFLWRSWLLRQEWPKVDVVHAFAGYATEAFDHAEKI